MVVEPHGWELSYRKRHIIFCQEMYGFLATKFYAFIIEFFCHKLKLKVLDS
jgi:hypothetical protein